MSPKLDNGVEVVWGEDEELYSAVCSCGHPHDLDDGMCHADGCGCRAWREPLLNMEADMEIVNFGESE